MTDRPTTDPAAQAAAALAQATGVAAHDVAVVLGSGWRPPTSSRWPTSPGSSGPSSQGTAG